MGNYNSGKRIYHVNRDFFKFWSNNMAYILGFTCADGNVYKRTLSWDLSNKFKSNFDLLKDFNKSLNSNYPILVKEFSYKLRISNSEILKDIKNLGIIPNKKKILIFPKVPEKYLGHFLRGFLEGDGWISIRIHGGKFKEVCVGFSNGSESFMKSLIEYLRSELKINNFNLRCREKEMKNGGVSKTYQIDFYSENAKKILFFLYKDLSEEDIFLTRKHEKYSEALKIFEFKDKVKKFGKKFVEADYMTEGGIGPLLDRYLNKEKFIPRKMAEKFGVSLSTIYRWLDKSGIRLFEKRGSEVWAQRVLISRKIVNNGK